ncbi:helix-turn-helix domain-containing protein [Ruegeria atlantica]|uniref:helix-turn-helix domain-containing protein n=1 Tax=Ruegeria atlantica TaxID=81569 RepID=UPI00147EC65F|nr:helix-turn-helix transcriptional regulator [Ruegeria atlantica]
MKDPEHNKPATENDEIWQRRRRNLNLLIHYKGTNASALSRQIAESNNIKFGVNTVNAVLNGPSKPKFETLEMICEALGLHNVSILDAENPISEIRNDLFGMVQAISEDQAKEALEFLSQRFPDVRAAIAEKEKG